MKYQLREGTSSLATDIDLLDRPCRGDILIRPNRQHLEVVDVMLYIDSQRVPTIVARCAHRFKSLLNDGEKCNHCDKEFRPVPAAPIGSIRAAASPGPLMFLTDLQGATKTDG